MLSFSNNFTFGSIADVNRKHLEAEGILKNAEQFLKPILKKLKEGDLQELIVEMLEKFIEKIPEENPEEILRE